MKAAHSFACHAPTQSLGDVRRGEQNEALRVDHELKAADDPPRPFPTLELIVRYQFLYKQNHKSHQSHDITYQHRFHAMLK